LFSKGFAELAEGFGAHAVELAEVGFGDFAQLVELRVTGVGECAQRGLGQS
jgi:hypothetical protein